MVYDTFKSYIDPERLINEPLIRNDWIKWAVRQLIYYSTEFDKNICIVFAGMENISYFFEVLYGRIEATVSKIYSNYYGSWYNMTLYIIL